ncbi:lamin tail domain-containing protein [Cyclobacterium plantarum]|uniref:lamin tail domain-containing protein n=1 Tax=Cyclobacterium plantarum TaxID=2716263 RepID=UPI003F72F8D7
MKAIISVWSFIAFSILGFAQLPKTETFEVQDFESKFTTINHPEEFLPAWSANELSTGTARVFQAAGEGLNQSSALGIQTIGSFNAQIYIKIATEGLQNPIISFYAKTSKIGSGNRPVLLYLSLTEDPEQGFGERIQIGDDNTFPNADTPYALFSQEIPVAFQGLKQVTLLLEAVYGSGSGSAARLFLDDFSIGGEQDQIKTLAINQVESIGNNSLLLHFNQPIEWPMEGVSLDNDYGNAKNATRIDSSKMLLEFEDYLYTNSYTLKFEQITGIQEGKIHEDWEHSFDLHTASPAGTLIINEIMPDPNPKGLLPPDPVLPAQTNAEYIELFNRSEKPVFLKDFTLNGGILEEVLMEPKSYLILSANSNKPLFAPFGPVAAVDAFPNLANNSGELMLRDGFDNLADSLVYDLAFYQNEEKSRGGWAMERINPFQACSDSFNWKASDSDQGGTPGQQNAVFSEALDKRPFAITKVSPISPDQILITFSKLLPPALESLPKFTLSGEELLVLDYLDQSMILKSATTMESDQTYTLKITQLTDCFGVSLATNAISFLYDTSPPKIEEIWGLSGKELLLVFDEALDLQQASMPGNFWFREDASAITAAHIDESAPHKIRLELDSPLQLGSSYELIADSIADRYGNYLLDLPISFYWEDVLDSIYFSSPNILKVVYKIPLDQKTILDPENYKLGTEAWQPRRILPVEDEENSYLLVFDREFPQDQNLILEVSGIRDPEGVNRFTLNKAFFWDTRNINLSELIIPAANSLLLTFNKALDPKWALIAQLYEVNEGIGSPKSLEMPNSHQVKLEFDSSWIPRKEYRLSISQLKDLYGQEISRSINRDFTWDTLPPVIDTAFLLSPFALELVWNKAIVVPDPVLVNGLQAENIVLSADGLSLTLFSEKPLVADEIQVTIPEVWAKTGELATNTNIILDNSLFCPGAVEIWDEQHLMVTFTDFPDPASLVFPENYHINFSPAKSALLMENGYQVKVELREQLTLEDSIFISIQAVRSKSGKEGLPYQESLFYADGIYELWVQNSQLIQINLLEALDSINPWEGLFRFLEDERNITPLLSKSQGNQVQLIIEESLPAGSLWTLKIPPRLGENGNRMPGSLRTVEWDPLPPELLEVEPLPENRLLLYFDQVLNPILAVVPDFYSIEGISPSSISLENNGKEILLTFENGWEAGQEITLEIRELEDMDGHAIERQSLTFPYLPPEIPQFKEMVINEIMPAPRPGSPLPGTEYIEIYNPTDKLFHLGGMKIANSRNESSLPRATVAPGGFLILCPEADKEAFDPFGQVLGLQHWPTLLNGGDEISLYNTHGDLVDRLIYDPSMPLGGEIANNGFSLEVINPFYPCESQENYAPSISPQRGTPGAINTAFDDSPDRRAPRLLAAIPKGTDQLLLRFSKPVGPHNASSEFQLSPQIDIKDAYPDPLDRFQWIILLETPLMENQAYQLQVNTWRDCVGNAISPEANLAWIKIPAGAEEGNLVLNEILFNPATGTPKFVEIYNHSSKLLNLKNWKLANEESGELANRRVISGDDLIIDPFSYLVLTTDVEKLAAQYPKGLKENFLEMALPSYPIRSGTVILLDPEELWEEKLDYNEDMHHGFLRDVKGISLERFSVLTPANEPQNWHSAAAHVGYASPGFKNSQVYDSPSHDLGIHISPEVFVPLAAGEQPFTTISYKMDRPGYQATLRIFSPTGIPIRELCQNEIWGSNGFYTWDGTNERGEKVNAGYYIVSGELFHPDGQVMQIKKTVVVGAKF